MDKNDRIFAKSKFAHRFFGKPNLSIQSVDKKGTRQLIPWPSFVVRNIEDMFRFHQGNMGDELIKKIECISYT